MMHPDFEDPHEESDHKPAPPPGVKRGPLDRPMALRVAFGELISDRYGQWDGQCWRSVTGKPIEGKVISIHEMTDYEKKMWTEF